MMIVNYDGAHGFTAQTRSLQGETATIAAADMGRDLHINIVHGRSVVLDPLAARELAAAFVWWADRRERENALAYSKRNGEESAS